MLSRGILPTRSQTPRPPHPRLPVRLLPHRYLNHTVEPFRQGVCMRRDHGIPTDDGEVPGAGDPQDLSLGGVADLAGEMRHPVAQAGIRGRLFRSRFGGEGFQVAGFWGLAFASVIRRHGLSSVGLEIVVPFCVVVVVVVVIIRESVVVIGSCDLDGDAFGRTDAGREVGGCQSVGGIVVEDGRRSETGAGEIVRAAGDCEEGRP